MNIGKHLHQTAVKWAIDSPDGYGGFIYDSPVEIAVRWEDKQEKYMTKSGEDKLSSAVIYTENDMLVGEYLLLGMLDDLESSSMDPQEEPEARRVEAVLKTPNLKATKFLIKVWL